MTITLDGSSLSIERLVAIARGNEQVRLAPEAEDRIRACRLNDLSKKEFKSAQVQPVTLPFCEPS